jgi:biotin carboxyl carrier protein
MDRYLRFTVNDRQFEHSDELPVVTAGPANSFSVSIDNETVEVFAYPDGRLSDGAGLDGVEVQVESSRDRLIKERFASTTQGAGALGGKQFTMKAPMPGLVKKILIGIGDQVTKQTPIIILEAMKMENVLLAGRQGVLTELKVTEGKNVDKNSILCLITES